MKLATPKVEYLYGSGDDLSVVNAARVSFSKQSDELTEKDIKLINYLAKHNHWTPFAHNSLTFRIKAPIFVARQLGKHQVGFVWNEVSRRYVDETPEFYYPETWRMRAENVKQGSSSEPCQKMYEEDEITHETFDQELFFSMDLLTFFYTKMIEIGVAPEQARMVLPQNMMTEWIWTGSLAGFARVAKLRLDPHAQQECRDVVTQIASICAEKFPYSWKALDEAFSAT